MGSNLRKVAGKAILALQLLSASAVCSAAAAGGTLSITVLDQDGKPVPDVVVSVSAPGGQSGLTSPRSPDTATMSQAGRAFVPHILVVETGTVIEFPNHDELLHHVYSFSAAKRFEFPLYGGTVSPQLQFELPGLVTLGCNIHDSMLGYILVVDTPHFAMTDASGHALLGNLPAGELTVELWTPRLRPDRLPAEIAFSLDENAAESMVIAFDSKLRPPHPQAGSSLTWDRY